MNETSNKGEKKEEINRNRIVRFSSFSDMSLSCELHQRQERTNTGRWKLATKRLHDLHVRGRRESKLQGDRLFGGL